MQLPTDRLAGLAWPVRVLLICTFLACAAFPAGAQQFGLPQGPILTISSERLFADSAFGRRIRTEIEAEGTELAAENRRIEAELTQEEHALTEKRPQLSPDEFRALADAFDEKVQSIRAEQESKARALVEKNETARAEFFQAARPILANLMRETGAAIILERSSVFLSSNATDITSAAIQRIDAVIGDGGDQ